MHSSNNESLNSRLLYRELHGNRGISSTAGLYGSKRWVEDLDIIGELRGHDGCINALEWSRDGSLLASGSDDTRVNIYKTNFGFSLNTQIETGHTQNIFSVKFMPHSSDRTVITAAGDTQVRIFDIEYAPTTFTTLSEPTEQPRAATPNLRRRRLRTMQQPTPGKVHDKPWRVYASHADRAKRIVTESSPHLFLTCSEDGTVRQFDLRQPSEFYTRPGANITRPAPFGLVALSADDEDARNPPLISYRRHGIDLNTISCSTSQPHYIAIGGSHLYCFLHDRRMLGRDRMHEAGQTYSRVPLREPDEDSLAGATKCVRRFAPRMGKNWDRKMQNSHVTACKISDANPNEVVVSWSGYGNDGGGVYLFDINRSPYPNEPGLGRDPWDPEVHARNERRTKQDHNARASAQKRRRSRSPSDSLPEDVVPGQGMRKICSLVVELRNELFGFSSSNLLADSNDLAAERRKSYDAALALAHTTLKRIHESIELLDQKDIEALELLGMSRSRSTLQSERSRRSTLAKNRRRIRSFVVAAGCVARAVGGFIEGIGLGVGAFSSISNGLNGAMSFRYRFLNAVIAFLNSGVEGIKEQAELFYQDEAELEDTDESRPPSPSEQEKFERYLRELERGAQPTLIRDVDTSEELFDSELTMLKAFRRALEINEPDMSDTAKRFWGERVARAVLMKEGEGIDFDFVERAFKGEDPLELRTEGEGASAGEASSLLGATEEEDDGDVGTPGSDEEPDSENDRDEDEDEDMDSDDDGNGGVDFWFRQRRNRRGPVEAHAAVWEHTKVYRGHCNVRTVKDVNFFGLNDEYVVSGSDCGNLFIWDKRTTKLIQLLYGDDETVNVAAGHPYEPLIAVSGIDYTVKLFSPDFELQREFGESAGAENMTGEGQTSYSGKASRRRMHVANKIIERNAVSSETGVPNALITVSLSGVAISFAEWQALYR